MLDDWQHWKGGILVNHQKDILQKDLLPGLMRKGERRNIIIYDEQAIFHYYSNKSLHWNVLVSQQQQSITNLTVGIRVCSIAQDLLLKIMFGYTHFYSLFFLLRKFEAAKSYLAVCPSQCLLLLEICNFIYINQSETWRAFKGSAYRSSSMYIGTALPGVLRESPRTHDGIFQQQDIWIIFIQHKWELPYNSFCWIS